MEIHFKETLVVLAFTFSALSSRSRVRVYTSPNLSLNSLFLRPYDAASFSAIPRTPLNESYLKG